LLNSWRILPKLLDFLKNEKFPNSFFSYRFEVYGHAHTGGTGMPDSSLIRGSPCERLRHDLL
jgi:hypothetical protein